MVKAWLVKIITDLPYSVVELLKTVNIINS